MIKLIKFRKKMLMFLASFLVLSAPLFAETIILKSGKQVEGKIIEKTDEYIKVDFYGIQLKYYVEDIEEIDGQPIKTLTKNNNYVSDKSTKTPKEIFKIASPAVVYIETDKGFGSGFIIDKSGIIITNYHVIALANDITLTLKNAEQYKPIAVLDYNILEDICILKIDAPYNLPFIPMGNDDEIEIGDEVLAIGNPLGKRYSLSDGLVSQIEDKTLYRKMIQFTCPISSGSSGGPLLNTKGEAIGIVTQVILPYDSLVAAQNLNFAVAINEAKALLSNNNKLSLQEFFAEDKKNAPLFTALFRTKNPQQAFNTLKEEFFKCTNLKNKYCFMVSIELLRSINLVLHDYMKKFGDFYFQKSGHFSHADLQQFHLWSMDALAIIEQAGGIKELIRSYKLYFNPSEQIVENSITNSFIVPFYTASLTSLLQGNEREAEKYYDKIKEYGPSSVWNEILAEFFKRYKQQGYIIK